MSTVAQLTIVVVLVALALPVVQPMFYFIVPPAEEDPVYDLYPELFVQKRASGSMNIPLSLRFGKRRYSLPAGFPHTEVSQDPFGQPMTKMDWLRVIFGRNPVHGYESELTEDVPIHKFRSG